MKDKYQKAWAHFTPGQRQIAKDLQAKCDYLSGLNDEDFFAYCKQFNIPAHLYGANARKKTNET